MPSAPDSAGLGVQGELGSLAGGGWGEGELTDGPGLLSLGVHGLHCAGWRQRGAQGPTPRPTLSVRRPGPAPQARLRLPTPARLGQGPFLLQLVPWGRRAAPRRASPSPWPGRDRSAEVRARSADGGGRPAAGSNLPRVPSALQARSGRGGPASRLAGGRAWAGPGQRGAQTHRRGTTERRGSRGGGREAIRERRDLGQVSRRDPGSKESSSSSPKEGRRGGQGGAGDGEGARPGESAVLQGSGR